MIDEVTESAPEAPVAEEVSLRDELVSAMNQAESKEPQVIEPEPTEATEDKAARKRDETGKFAKQEENAAEEAPVEVAKPAVAAPNSWSATAKAKWGELPPEIQAEVAKRESEVEKGFTRFDEERNFGKQLKEVITPYMPLIQAEGGDAAGAVKDLLNTAYVLRTATPQKKGELIMQLAHQFGADLSGASVPDQGPIDPKVQWMEQRLAQLEGHLTQSEQLKQQQVQASITSQIEQFAADPQNAHFETVKAEMAALLTGGSAKDLREAYDMAVWARPDIRSTLLEAQQREAEAKRLAETKARAEQARKAAGSVTGGPGIAVPNVVATPNRSLRDELAANFEALARA